MAYSFPPVSGFSKSLSAQVPALSCLRENQGKAPFFSGCDCSSFPARSEDHSPSWSQDHWEMLEQHPLRVHGRHRAHRPQGYRSPRSPDDHGVACPSCHIPGLLPAQMLGKMWFRGRLLGKDDRKRSKSTVNIFKFFIGGTLIMT